MNSEIQFCSIIGIIKNFAKVVLSAIRSYKAGLRGRRPEMIALKNVHPHSATQIEEPPLAKFLFADSRIAVLWLVVRLYVGYEWLVAGWEKLTGGWISGPTAGKGVAGFAMGALKLSAGAHPAVQGWYATFLQHVVIPNALLFSYLVTFGEILVGLGLIVGALTGVAAFFGVVMNMNYLLAGTVSINPILGVLGLLLILAWRVAGYYGLDSYLLPLLGTPWTGSLAKKEREATSNKEQSSVPLAAK
jgi:thiosulfate dehydrogenase [quinone] large subunit